MSTEPHAAPRADLATIAAVAVVVGILSNQLHEAGGHGGACLALGQHLATWGAFYVDCDTHDAPRWMGQVVAAAGSTVNVIAGFLSFIAFKATPAGKSLTRWFWWFAFALNGMVWAGYYAFSGVSGIGDWGQNGVFDGVAGWMYWRIALAIGGVVLYWLWVRWSMRELGNLTGRDDAGRKQARRISIVSYFVHGAAAVAVGVLNPIGLFIVFASAAASSFGGASGLLWGPRYLRPGPAANPSFVIKRNWAWIVCAVALVIAVALVLGPSINFAE